MTQLPVSTIIPTFNRADMLRQTIDSVLSGTAVPAEIIVVDDGSLDDTAAVVRSYGARLHYLHQPNAGKPIALNRALAIVGHPLVWIMDDDDLARPDGLARLYAALASDDDAGFAYGRYTIFSDAGAKEERLPLVPRADAETFHLGQLSGCSVLQPAMLVRKACYDAVGPFDTALLRSQDYEMLLRLARRYRAVEILEPIFDQRQHDAPRGTAALQRQSRSSLALWQHYDLRIFRRIHADYSLPEYLPPAERSNDAMEHRALVRRAGIMGRRGLWDLAVGDLHLAAACAVQDLASADVAVFAAALLPLPPSPIAVPLRALRRAVRTFDGESRTRLLGVLDTYRRTIWRGRARRLYDRTWLSRSARRRSL